jgi:hypothetical protein
VLNGIQLRLLPAKYPEQLDSLGIAETTGSAFRFPVRAMDEIRKGQQSGDFFSTLGPTPEFKSSHPDQQIAYRKIRG